MTTLSKQIYTFLLHLFHIYFENKARKTPPVSASPTDTYLYPKIFIAIFEQTM